MPTTAVPCPTDKPTTVASNLGAICAATNPNTTAAKALVACNSLTELQASSNGCGLNITLADKGGDTILLACENPGSGSGIGLLNVCSVLDQTVTVTAIFEGSKCINP